MSGPPDTPTRAGEAKRRQPGPAEIGARGPGPGAVYLGRAIVPNPRKVDSYRPNCYHLEPDPVVEAYKSGVDRTLLRERLRLSVEERLRDLMRMQAFAEQVREAGRRSFG